VADAGHARMVDTLRRALDFANLDDEQLRRLVTASSLERFAAGETLFEKGSPADGLYVVMDGSVRIFDQFRGEERDLALIEPGDFTGEVSLALHTSRTRSAQAKEDSEVLVIPTAALESLATEHPALASQLIEAFEDRMAAREDAAAEE
jgi:CRP-like cAMP-binding protein